MYSKCGHHIIISDGINSSITYALRSQGLSFNSAPEVHLTPRVCLLSDFQSTRGSPLDFEEQIPPFFNSPRRLVSQTITDIRYPLRSQGFSFNLAPELHLELRVGFISGFLVYSWIPTRFSRRRSLDFSIHHID